MIGCNTSAIMKRQGNSLLNPKFGYSVFIPYVGITEPLAAYSWYGSAFPLNI